MRFQVKKDMAGVVGKDESSCGGSPVNGSQSRVNAEFPMMTTSFLGTDSCCRTRQGRKLSSIEGVNYCYILKKFLQLIT